MKLLTFFFITLFFTQGFSQEPVWENTFEIDRGIAKGEFVQTSDGGYLLTGMASKNGITGVITIKIDKNGKKLWEAPYYPDYMIWNRLILELKPDVYTIVSIFADCYLYIQEYTKDGELIRTFFQEDIYSRSYPNINFLNDKYYLLTYKRNEEGWLYEAIKTYDSDGYYLGIETYDSLYYTDYQDIIIQKLYKLNNSGYVAHGKYQRTLDYKYENIIFIFDDSVNIIDRIPFEKPERVETGSFELLNDQTLIHYGKIDAKPWYIGQPRDTNRAFLWKQALNGETIWIKKYTTTLYSLFSDVLELENGNIIAVGHSVSEQDSNIVQFYMLKTDSDGNILYKRTWGYPVSCLLLHAILNRDGNIVVSGKYDGNPYIAEFDINTLDVLNGNEINNCNINVYPNPSVYDSKVNIYIDEPGNYRIDIVDETGRIVGKIKNTWLEEGHYQEQLDVSGYNSGRYFLRLTNDLMTITKLLCIVK